MRRPVPDPCRSQFSERLALVPNSYFVTDHRQQPAWAGVPDPAVSRAEYPELPARGLLLACFNQVRQHVMSVKKMV